MAPYTLQGPDTSYAQGALNPANFPGQFAIVNASRANIGLATGSYYHQQVTAFRNQGRHIGHYFFNGNLDPTTCANYFVAQLFDHRAEDSLWLDCESEPGTNTVAWGPGKALVFVQRVYQLTGKRVGIYLNKSLMNGANWSELVAFGSPLWLAYYDTALPPLRWWTFATVWQHTSAGYDHNRALPSLLTGVAPTPVKPKGPTVIFRKNYQDRQQRQLAPGGKLFLNNGKSDVNVVGPVSSDYFISPHVVITGLTYGDSVTVLLVWENTKNAKPGDHPSYHYSDTRSANREGEIHISLTFQHGVAKGDMVFVQVESDATNQSTGTTQLIDCDTRAIA